MIFIYSKYNCICSIKKWLGGKRSIASPMRNSPFFKRPFAGHLKISLALAHGAVGLSAVMAARVAGATCIIAADVVSSRLAPAKELGATHTVNSRETDPIEAVRKITGGGADQISQAAEDSEKGITIKSIVRLVSPAG